MSKAALSFLVEKAKPADTGERTPLRKDTTTGQEAHGVCWESLEGLMRERIQGWLQALLEAEVTEFLGLNGERRGKRRPAIGR